MSRSDIVGFTVSVIFFFVALRLILEAGTSGKAKGNAEGFRRGWIAGIDYEKQRRESNDEKA